MHRFVLTCGILLLSTSAWSAEGVPSVPVAPATLTVTGSTSGEFPPDTAILNLAVETRKETAEASARENAVQSGKVVEALKGLVDPAAGDTVATTSYTVQPVTEYDDKLRRSKTVGYRTFNQVTVRTRKLVELGALIDRALKSGATTVTDIRFALNESGKACEGLLVKATRRARADAETVADALGVKISGVRHAAPACGGDSHPIPVFRPMAAARTMDAVEAATPIETGTISLNAQVQVEFALIP